MILESWSPDLWRELGDLLNIDPKIIPQKLSDFEKCSYLLSEWLKRSDGDKMGKLADVFKKEEYHHMSDLILSLPI